MSYVSVIIPTHNRAHTLIRALDSVLRQSFRDWELIVVDDASTDGTRSVVANWSKVNQVDVRYLETAGPQPSGVSAARNQGAEIAQGRWLAFLDSDDEWLPEKLERQMTCGDFPLIHGEEVWIRNSIRVNPMKKHAKSGGRIFSRCVELCCISPSTAMIKKELFAELGGFRTDFPVCEDYELWLRVCSRYEVGFVAEPIVRKYGGHEDQLSRRFKAMDYYRIQALLPFVNSAYLTEQEKEIVRDSIRKRREILRKGLKKNGGNELDAELLVKLKQDLAQGADS